ncbi:MAG: nucleotidyltransferase [Bacteroidales bacterium]|nr:nucleotidyltransferase [Bacteroidales bacterium]
MKSLIECTKHICKTLNDHNVEYLIIGGTAVAIHGYIRLSTASDGTILGKHDLDIWYNPTYENYFKLLKALKVLGFESDFIDEKNPDPNKSFFKHEFEDYKLDFLPNIIGLDKFNEAFKHRYVINLDGIELTIISYDDLLITKKFSKREKDKIDIEMLRKNKSN